MRRKWIGLTALAVFAICSAARGEELVYDDQWKAFYKQLSTEEPVLMPRGWLDMISLPPPPGDAYTRVEVQHIIELRRLRGAYQERIDAQLGDVVHPFAEAFDLGSVQVQALRAFWDMVIPDITRVHMRFKAKFNRARPRQYSSRISPSIAEPGHPAYPSGHSTDAHVLAFLLADIWPDRRTQLMSIAQQIAMNREIGGVHYRSDTAAGVLLAEQIVELLPRNTRVRLALAEIREALTRW